MASLAIAGGKPLFSGENNRIIDPWPPRDERTAKMLYDVFKSGKWSFNSPAEQEFEQAFAKYHGAKYAVFMANGTVTLECALVALGIKPGDEVIVPALTWMATALAGAYHGAIPVVVDIDPNTLCMDPDKMEQAITPRTKAIIPVHVYGSTADLDRILEIADKHGIPVIEDCAHAHGGTWRGRGVGSWGKVGSFSFQQSKTMASGEGGICITNDEELAKKIYLLKHIGYQRGVKQGQGTRAPEGLLCHNYRSTAFAATILLSQLQDMPDRMARYNKHAKLIRELISDTPVRTQAPGRLSDPQGYYSFHFIFDDPAFEGIPTKLISEACAAEGYKIVNVAHGPIYQHALFNLNAAKGEYRIGDGGCPVCESLSTRMLGINHYELFYEENARRVAEVIKKVSDNIAELRKLV